MKTPDAIAVALPQDCQLPLLDSEFDAETGVQDMLSFFEHEGAAAAHINFEEFEMAY